MNRNWIFGITILSLFVIGVIGAQSTNMNISRNIEINNKPLAPTRKLDNGKCLYNNIESEEFKINKEYYNVVPYFFYYNTESPRKMQLSQDNYKELLAGNFKIIKTGVPSNPSKLDEDLLIKDNEVEEQYNLSIYNRNTTNSTELITSTCYTYFMANNLHKEHIYQVITNPNSSHPSDDELLKFFNKESLHLKEYQTKKDFDKFKKETTLISDSYGGALLYGNVKEKYRSKQNTPLDIYLQKGKDFNKNEKLIQSLGVYTILTVNAPSAPIIDQLRIYDTDGAIHKYNSSMPNIEKKDENVTFTYKILIDLSRKFLLDHSSGFELKIEAGDYSNIITIPDTMAKSFLDELDSI